LLVSDAQALNLDVFHPDTSVIKPATAVIQSRPCRPVFGISTPTRLEAIAVAPTTRQMTVLSAHTAAYRGEPQRLHSPYPRTAVPGMLRLRVPTLLGLLILVRFGQQELIVSSQPKRSPDENVSNLGHDWISRGRRDGQRCRLEEWWVAYAVLTVIDGGSELLIFVPRGSQS
jgi:hypothetical protein